MEDKQIMEYIRRIPFMMASGASIVIGLVSYTNGDAQKSTYIKMAVTLVIFYILGTVLCKVIVKTMQEIKRRKEEEEKKRQEEELAAQKAKREKAEENGSTADQPSTIDIRVGDK